MTQLPTPEPEQQPMLSLDDLAHMFGIAKRTLHHWRANGQLPHPDLVVGKTRRWWRSTILQWISEKKGSPMEEALR